MTYCTETRRHDSIKTERLLERKEMKVFRRIDGKTPLDREGSENLRRSCKAENINEGIYKGGKNGIGTQINRMSAERDFRIARDKFTLGYR